MSRMAVFWLLWCCLSDEVNFVPKYVMFKILKSPYQFRHFIKYGFNLPFLCLCVCSSNSMFLFCFCYYLLPRAFGKAVVFRGWVLSNRAVTPLSILRGNVQTLPCILFCGCLPWDCWMHSIRHFEYTLRNVYLFLLTHATAVALSLSVSWSQVFFSTDRNPQCCISVVDCFYFIHSFTNLLYNSAKLSHFMHAMSWSAVHKPTWLLHINKKIW